MIDEEGWIGVLDKEGWGSDGGGCAVRWPKAVRIISSVQVLISSEPQMLIITREEGRWDCSTSDIKFEVKIFKCACLGLLFTGSEISLHLLKTKLGPRRTGNLTPVLHFQQPLN